MIDRRTVRAWSVGEYTFTEIELWRDDEWKTYFAFTIDDKTNFELYATLDKALIAAVGEKHTGPRGAGGSGVATAADWFAKMIGLE